MNNLINYFPFVLNLENRRILFVGGGRVAESKIKTLLKYIDNPNIFVYSIDITEELKKLLNASKITYKKMDANDLEKRDLEPFDIIIASSNDNELNRRICEIGRELNKFVLNVSDKNDSDLFFPSILIVDDVVIAISSLGKNPAKVKKIREMLEEFFETKPQ